MEDIRDAVINGTDRIKDVLADSLGGIDDGTSQQIEQLEDIRDLIASHIFSTDPESAKARYKRIREYRWEGHSSSRGMIMDAFPLGDINEIAEVEKRKKEKKEDDEEK